MSLEGVSAFGGVGLKMECKAFLSHAYRGRDMAGTWHHNHRKLIAKWSPQQELQAHKCGANPKPKCGYGVRLKHNGSMLFQDFLNLGCGAALQPNFRGRPG